MKIPKLTYAEAHTLLYYNPESGNLRWKISTGKSREGKIAGVIQHGYRKTQVKGEQLRVSRLVWFMAYGKWPEGQIDHIDGDKLNNRLSNLRDVPASINMQNRYATKNKKNGLPYGVSKTPSGRYHANIRIGTYDTIAEATEEFMKAKRLIHSGCTR